MRDIHVVSLNVAEEGGKNLKNKRQNEASDCWHQKDTELSKVHGSKTEHFCEAYLPEEDKSCCEAAKTEKNEYELGYELSKILSPTE